MASSHGDHTVRIVDCKTGRCLNTLRGHPRTPWCVAFHPSSDELLASGCLGGQVRVWNLKVRSKINVKINAMWPSGYSTGIVIWRP